MALQLHDLSLGFPLTNFLLFVKRGSVVNLFFFFVGILFCLLSSFVSLFLPFFVFLFLCFLLCFVSLSLCFLVFYFLCFFVLFLTFFVSFLLCFVFVCLFVCLFLLQPYEGGKQQHHQSFQYLDKILNILQSSPLIAYPQVGQT